MSQRSFRYTKSFMTYEVSNIICLPSQNRHAQSRYMLLSKEVKITNIIAAGIAYNIMLRRVMLLV